MSYLRDKLRDKAWSITRRVIEGADARYGLRLYARVDEEKLGAYSIWFISPKMNRRFGCWIDCFEEVSPERETRFVERLLHTMDDFLKDPEGWIKREQTRLKERRDNLYIDFERKRMDLHEGHRRQMEDWQAELEQTVAQTREWAAANGVDVDVPGVFEWVTETIGERPPNHPTAPATDK